jgi:hypothetical protein
MPQPVIASSAILRQRYTSQKLRPPCKNSWKQMALGVAENATPQKESGSEPGGVPKLGVFSRSRPNLWDTVVAVWVCVTIERKAFSYNKRTMDRAMGPF